jgi:Domain of unknown function (DUF4394)
MSRLLTVLLALAAAALAAPAVAAAGERFYALDEANRLVSFTSDTPRAIARARVSGLAPGEQLLGLDVRPATQELYGVGSTARIYKVDPSTGTATAVGPAAFVPGLNGGLFGFDFNPTVDRIRLVSDRRQNLRLHPDTGAVAAVDGGLAYAAADSAAGSTPTVVASAYTNSVKGATTTLLYGLDAQRDTLVTQVPPNAGTLNTVGRLGVDVTERAGFDIAGSDGTAFAALESTSGPGSTLYRIDLSSGAASAVGRIGGAVRIRALAAAGTAIADSRAPRASVVSIVRVRGELRVRVRCDEACSFTLRARVGGRVVALARAQTDLAGSISVRLRAGLGVGRVSVELTAMDAAGNVAAIVSRRG